MFSMMTYKITMACRCEISITSLFNHHSCILHCTMMQYVLIFSNTLCNMGGNEVGCTINIIITFLSLGHYKRMQAHIVKTIPRY